MENEIIILRIDELLEKIETTQEGTFLHVERLVLEEWIDELKRVVEGG